MVATTTIENDITQPDVNQEIVTEEMRNSALKNAGLIAAATSEDEDIVVVQDFQEEPE